MTKHSVAVIRLLGIWTVLVVVQVGAAEKTGPIGPRAISLDFSLSDERTPAWSRTSS